MIAMIIFCEPRVGDLLGGREDLLESLKFPHSYWGSETRAWERDYPLYT